MSASSKSSILRNSRRSITKNGIRYEIDLGAIPEEIVDSLRIAFNSLDMDNSGKIGIPEIQEFLEEHGNPLTEEEVIENFFEHDKDSDYQLDFEEFAARMAPMQEIINDPVIEAFKNFAGKSKFIDAIQLKRILVSLGKNKFTEEEVDTVFKELGIKIADIIEYEKFVKEWREKANLKLE